MSKRRKPDADCQECGLYKLCESPIMEGTGADDPVIMFVGEAPGETEDEKDKAFVGKMGQLLRLLTKEVGIPIDRCRFSNAIRCRPPNNDLKPFKKAGVLCKPKILREIHHHNPKVVVLLGNYAIGSVLGKKGIVKLHGEVFSGNGRKYICCVHPSYLSRNMTDGWLRKFKNALETAAVLGGFRRKIHVEKVRYEYIRDKKMLYEFTDLLKKRKELTTDIESSTLSPYQVGAQTGCVSFSWEKRYSVVFPIHARTGLEHSLRHLPVELVIEAWKELWTCKDILFTTHFGKHDDRYAWVLHKFRMANYYHDTGLMSYAWNIQKGIHGLDDWELRLGGDLRFYRAKRQWELDHPECNPSKGGNANLVPAKILYPYNAEDTDWTWRIKEHLLPLLQKKGKYDMPYRFPLMKCINPMAEYMEKVGLNVDLEKNNELLTEFPAKIQEFEEEIRRYPEYDRLEFLAKVDLMEKAYLRVLKYKRQPPNFWRKVKEMYYLALAGKRKSEHGLVKLNTDATKRRLVYEILDLVDEDRIVKTNTGLPSVKAGVLADIARTRQGRKAGSLTLLIKRAEYSSANNKYVRPIRKWCGLDGRTHTTYKPHGQDTGRVSSENPNHENLIKRGDAWIISNIQEQFVPTDDDYILAKADEKQIEMRLFCDRARDKVMLKEFREFKDPHAMGAMTFFVGEKLPFNGVNYVYYDENGWNRLPDALRKSLRHFAKSAISFGILYGRHAKALARDMGWSLRKGQKYIDRYFDKYWRCREYIEEQDEYIRENGLVISHFGRHRPLPEAVESDDWGVVSRAVRQGINAPIQGDASDIVWTAAWRLMKWLQKYRMRTRIVIIEHDAIYLDMYRREREDVVPQWEKFMIDRHWIQKMTGWFLKAPLAIDIAFGHSMAQLNSGKYELKKDNKTGEWFYPPAVKELLAA